MAGCGDFGARDDVITGGVGGRAELRHVEALLRNAPKELKADLRKRLRMALEPLKKDVPAEALALMPHRGGYAPLLAKATKVEIRIYTTSDPKATVRVSASGKGEERDVKALNAGTLRHPLFGHRAWWYEQRVRPGFVDVPIKQAQGRVQDAAESAVDDIADHIERG